MRLAAESVYKGPASWFPAHSFSVPALWFLSGFLQCCPHTLSFHSGELLLSAPACGFHVHLPEAVPLKPEARFLFYGMRQKCKQIRSVPVTLQGMPQSRGGCRQSAFSAALYGSYAVS